MVAHVSSNDNMCELHLNWNGLHFFVSHLADSSYSHNMCGGAVVCDDEFGHSTEVVAVHFNNNLPLITTTLTTWGFSSYDSLAVNILVSKTPCVIIGASNI